MEDLLMKPVCGQLGLGEPKRRRMPGFVSVNVSQRYAKKAITEVEPIAFANADEQFDGARYSFGITSLSLECDRKMVHEPHGHGTGAYGHGWYSHHRETEKVLNWNNCYGENDCQLERAHLDVIRSYYDIAGKHKFSMSTVQLAIGNYHRLLTNWQSESWTATSWALTAVSAMRLALKFEEQPESLWDFPNIWKVFQNFQNWDIDRSESTLIKAECSCLRVLKDCIDLPLPCYFFDRFLIVGGWPTDMVPTYASLGYYILHLANFTSGEGHLLQNRAPSMLAAASVVLSIKIVNADSHRTFEFYPKRLEVYAGYSLQELQPVVRGLSQLLRSKPKEAEILSCFFPTWAVHDWK
eukprot:GHVO01000509.1.p1 GENE.GHVO01000509.1~~GHVO01000509.1.p1  ORF type:complete len:353 (+),score=22.54 GHVO01000509.1:207-1265(+)